MDLDEIKERYKMIPLWARFLIAGIIGLLPGAYVYWDEGDALQTQLDEQATKETDVRAKFEDARQQKANVPKLEEELEFTEQQLQKAKQKLPDTYHIEDVLQKAATIAKEVGVKLLLFEPGEDILHQDEYHYVEKPISTSIEGKFGQIAAFFDRVVHLEQSVFVRNIAITQAERAGLAPQTEGTGPVKSDFQQAKEARQNLRLKATFDLAMFRGMTQEEENRPAKSDIPGEIKQDKPGKGENGEAPAEAPVGEAPPAPPAGEHARATPARDGDVTTF